MTAHLFTQQNPSIFLDALVRQFLSPRLDREVGLTLRHDFLVGIGVLNYEVTGVARKQCDFDLAPATFSDLDHFADVSKMILNAVSTIETGHFGLFNNPLKIAVITVTQ